MPLNLIPKIPAAREEWIDDLGGPMATWTRRSNRADAT